MGEASHPLEQNLRETGQVPSLTDAADVKLIAAMPLTPKLIVSRPTVDRARYVRALVKLLEEAERVSLQEAPKHNVAA